MMLYPKKQRLIAFAFAGAMSAFQSAASAQSNIDPMNKFSWSENPGHMNWHDADNGTGVFVAPDHLSGLIWFENVGYMNVGNGNHPYGNTDNTDFGINILPNGDLDGLAWAENLGWANFGWGAGSGNADRARYDAIAQRFFGYVWLENGGWVNLDDNNEFVATVIVIEPPVLAPPPDDIRKNRYISIDPRGANGINAGKDLDIRITLTRTKVNDVMADGSHWWADAPDANCISIVGSTPPAVPPNWDACPTLHLTGCPIIPTSTYDIVAVIVGMVSDPPLEAQTQLRPADSKWWGDAVGNFTGDEGNPPNVWTAPQGVTNFDDVNAALRTFIDPGALNATHTSVTDIHPNRPDLGGNSVHPNRLVSIDDVFQFIKAFQGAEYPGAAIDLCP